MLHLGRLRPNTQTLDQAGKLARAKRTRLLQKFKTYGVKFFITLAPGVNLIKLFIYAFYDCL